MDPLTKPAARLSGLDALRGAVMIVMALDHVRDFVNISAMSFSPTDLEKTTPVLFFTRWITHFCLPVFMFTAGAGAFLWQHQGRHSRGELSRFLWTRGLWFIVLELTVMRLAYNFDFSTSYPVFLVVLWIFGICMLVMAVLVRLPMSWLFAFSVAVIVLHNALDGIRVQNIAWGLIHQPGLFMVGRTPVIVPYTLLPWIGVMTAGFCFGQVLTRSPEARRRIMLRIGLGMVIAFLVLRTINHYGDPAPWSVQKSAMFTLLSFLNCTKYPGSLDFLLMTLGPALVLLSWLDRWRPSAANPLIVFGRVPFFYFVLHFYLIHAVAAVLALVRYGGGAVSFIFNPPPSMGAPAKLFPPHYGYSLPATYAVWIFVVVSLYPVCRWYASYRATHRRWWLSYL